MKSERTMESFKHALAAQMEATGLQQLELAVRSDVSEAAVSLYLSGQRQPRPTTIEKLARGLDIPPEYFREWREAKAKQLVQSAMAEGIIELEDIELVLAVKRFERGDS